MPGFAAQTHHGSDMRIGAIRERGAGWTTYDVSYSAHSEGPGAYTDPLTISGVLTIPDGDGPFPVAVLAHGYIDPAKYVTGQGMTRERKWLGERGWATLHTDYRGHAASDEDPTHGADVRLGYAVDVIAALDALRTSDDSQLAGLDVDRAAVFGRSMGGGIAQKVLQIAPDAFGVGVMWAAVSSLEAENVDWFVGLTDARTKAFTSRLATPEEDPEFWEGVSTRPFFDRITAPVLIVHGRTDDVCPPAWAEETYDAMRRAGVDVELEWYGEGHSFDADFAPAMERSFAFSRKAMPRIRQASGL